ncbi:rhamnan synthesis F family protein [Acetobacter fallax]|uniref:Glycosyl transferase n=1 Tax=Acetobacter fallax TaxID=1737473 RepID=A0ABX0K5F9_9PROT|nr:rhamnan synthesis F family protein [Acetobacter fallax]NHO31614.1 glycosyl transferase [Acetobacter fallax]NHO35173.1 glycosyl transferase [Acetobacter fallax]
MPEQVCLFAAYTPDGRLPPHTVYYLSELTSCGFSVHVALSGAEQISDETEQLCHDIGIILWPRPNIGHDFASWQHLLLNGCIGTASRVLLANDSVFGPLTPLKPIFRRMQSSGADVWGMVQTRAITPHLQSWFVCFEHNSISTPPVQRTLHQNFTDMTREELIWHAELGLAIACRAGGLATKALWSDRKARTGAFLATNPMHSHWRQLAGTGTVPFIKTELLRDNPFHLKTTSDWKQLVRPSSGFKPEWIDDYLRTNPPRIKTTPSNLKGRLLYNLIDQFTGRKKRALPSGVLQQPDGQPSPQKLF